MSYSHFDDHKFHKDRFGNETQIPQNPRVWLIAGAMIGPYYVIFSYHQHLSDKLAQISNWLSPWKLQLQKPFALPQCSCLWFYRNSSQRKLHICGDTIQHLVHASTASSGPKPPHFLHFENTPRHTTVGRTTLDEWSTQTENYYNTQHSQETDIHAPGRIWTHNLSKRGNRSTL